MPNIRADSTGVQATAAEDTIIDNENRSQPQELYNNNQGGPSGHRARVDPFDEPDECSDDLYNDLIYEYNQVQMESCPTELDEERALEVALAESMEGSCGVAKSVGEARATFPRLCILHATATGAS